MWEINMGFRHVDPGRLGIRLRIETGVGVSSATLLAGKGKATAAKASQGASAQSCLALGGLPRTAIGRKEITRAASEPYRKKANICSNTDIYDSRRTCVAPSAKRITAASAIRSPRFWLRLKRATSPMMLSIHDRLSRRVIPRGLVKGWRSKASSRTVPHTVIA